MGVPGDKPVSAFSSKELTVRPTRRQVHAGRQHNKATGGPRLKRREGLDQRRGKYLPRASDGQNGMKTQNKAESRILCRKKCEK